MVESILSMLWREWHQIHHQLGQNKAEEQKYVDPRNIPPSVIEDAIRNTTAVPGHTVGTFVHQTVEKSEDVLYVELEGKNA